MRNDFRRLVALAFALAVPAISAMTANASDKNVAQFGEPVVVPKLVYTTRTLPNGLTVYAAEDHRTPTVAIQVWYKVGSKNDPPGRSGFAHLFEHMMFKSTTNMADEDMDRLTEDVGGENNAYTQDDVTVYHETVPSNYLETLLWAESDRMANLDVDARNFHSERMVVEEEYRSSVLAPPYGRLDDEIPRLSFAVHPYRRPTIGSIHDLNASSLAEVQQFHRTYYRPDNAVLVVVGDFEPDQLSAFIDKYFGRIARPSESIPRVTDVEPPRKAAKRFDITAPEVPLPAVALTYLTPGMSSPDAPALRIADEILSSGDSSRLYKSLMYDQQLASDVQADTDMRTDAGLFTVQVTAASGKSLDKLTKATLDEIAKLRDTPPTDAEMDKARNQLLSGAFHERQTVDGTASALGESAVLLGDPERINTDIERLQAVTASDVQRVARTYLVDDNRVEIRYKQAPGKPSVSGAGDATLPTAGAPTQPVHGAGSASSATIGTAGAAHRETPPAPAAPRPITAPLVFEDRMRNGLRVICVPRPRTGLVTAELLVRSGGALDPLDKAGLSDFTASLLTKGTTTKKATQIAEGIAALGGSIHASAGYDSTDVILSVLSANADRGMRLFADVILRPAFKADEISRRRAEEIDDFNIGLESPETLAHLVATRAIYGASPYAHPIGGTPESLKRITRADIAGFHEKYYRPENSVLVITGDIVPHDGFALAQHLLGDWLPASGRAVPFTGAPTTLAPPVMADTADVPGSGNPVLVIDSPEAGQSAVLATRLTIARRDPDYFTALVANSVLGGGYSSRLNREIRVKRGLSYGADSGLNLRQTSGSFVAAAQTKNQSAGEVAALLIDQLAGLATDPLPAEELSVRVAALRGDYLRHLETSDGIADELASLALFDQPLSELTDYPAHVAAVTAEQVRSFASRRLKAEGALVVIVGDARQFLPAVHRRFTNIRVISQEKVDLNKVILLK